MRGLGESSSAGRASATLDSDAQLARRLQKLLDEEALDEFTTSHNREKQIPRRKDKQSGAEKHGFNKGKGKARSDDFAHGNERLSNMRPESTTYGDEEHEYANSARDKRGKSLMQYPHASNLTTDLPRRSISWLGRPIST